MKRLRCIAYAAAVGCLTVWALKSHLSTTAADVLTVVWKAEPLAGFKPQSITIYYTTAQDNELSERQVMHGRYDLGRLELTVPSDLTSFRLDLGFANPLPEGTNLSCPPEKVEINGVGQRMSSMNVFKLGNPRYIAVYYPKLDLRHHENLRFLPTLVVFVATVCFSYWMVSHIGGWFVLIFFFLCLLPWARLSQEDVSERENRRLATFPKSFDPKAFELALNDRMFGREQLLDLKNFIFARLGVEDKKGKALVGKDGWLYYKDTLEDFANLTCWGEADMRAMGDYLNVLFEYCKSRGKRFAFMICPDKCRVYPEYVVQYLKANPDSMGKTERLVTYLRKNYAFPVVYSRERLIDFKAKVPRPLYYLKDTHWSWEGGCYGGYQPMMEALGLPAKEMTQWKEIPGDSCDLLSMNAHAGDVPDMKTYAKPDFPFALARPQSDVDLENVGGQGRLFMLRDSFATAMTPYINLTFRNAVLRWRAALLPEDREAVDSSDSFVYEIVERSIPALCCIARCGRTIPWEVN